MTGAQESINKNKEGGTFLSGFESCSDYTILCGGVAQEQSSSSTRRKGFRKYYEIVVVASSTYYLHKRASL